MSHHIVRFGRYYLDAPAHELWRDRDRIALPPKSFECLAYLLEHRDRTVGRDELISAVWGRTDVADTVLAQTLLRARRAVGDTGGEQTVVRTIPRFGYRWVAAVEVVDAPTFLPESASPGPASDPIAVASREVDLAVAVEPNGVAEPPVEARVASRSHRGGPRRPWVVAATSLVLIVVLGLLFIRQQHRSVPQPSGPLAPEENEARELFIVLPVTLPNKSAETAWIRLGAMDYVASRLREDADLQVLPSDQVVALLGSSKGSDPHTAEELRHLEMTTGASYILAPRASYSGGDWHFAFDVYHEGAMRTFEANSGAPLQAAGGVVARFLESIGSTDLAERPEPPALTELLKRIDAAVLGGDLEGARQLAETAPANLRNEPSLAIRVGRIAGRAGRLAAAEQVLRPLALDDSSLPVEIRAQAKNYLGGIAARRNDFDAAEREYAGAIAVLGDHGQPGLLGWAYMGRGLATGSLDRFDDALVDFGRARIAFERAGDVLSIAGLDTNVGIVEARRGRYVDAVNAYDRAIAVFTRFDSRDNLAIALFDKTDAQLNLLDLPAALASSAQGWDLGRGLENSFLVRRLGVVRIRALLACGQLKAAMELIEHFRKLGSPEASSDPEFALMHAQLLSLQGNFEAALTEANAILDRIERPSDPTDIATLSEVSLVLIEAAIRTGDIGKAEQVLARLQTAPTPAKDNERAFAQALAQAKVSAARGEVVAASQFDKAIAIADRMGQPFAVVTAGVAYARYLIDRHQLEDASAVVGRLMPYIERDYRAARAAAALYTALGEERLAQAASVKVRALAGERNPDLPL